MSTTDTTASASFSVSGPDPILEDAEHKLVGQANPIVFQAVKVSHGTLRSYGQRHDYDTDSIEESFAGVDVERSDGELMITWRWEHEAAAYFNNGTSDHTIEGQDVLAFVFDESEYPYLAEMFPDGTAFLPEVDVSGLPESRYVQAGLEWLRQEVS